MRELIEQRLEQLKRHLATFMQQSQAHILEVQGGIAELERLLEQLQAQQERQDDDHETQSSLDSCPS